MDIDARYREEGELRPDVDYERKDVWAKQIAIGAVALLALVVITIVVVAIPFFMLKRHRADVSGYRSPEAAATRRIPPEPRLQPSPELDLQGYTAGYSRALKSYEWVDRSKGIAIIPLKRAMEISIQRGIQRFPVNASIPLSQPRQGSQITGYQGKVIDPQR